MTELNLPPGWRINTTEPGAANLTQDDIDRFVDTYYRTGPGKDLGGYSTQAAVGAFNPAAAASAKRSYMEAHPNFETQPFVEGAARKASRDATIAGLRPDWTKTISDAFTAYGADPTKYSGDIENRLASLIAGIPADATDYNKYFADQDVGNKLISELEPGYRKTAKDLFAKDVPTDFLADTADDAAIEALLTGERGTADKFIQNMIDRGVITDTGATAARADLDKQTTGGRTRLNEIGAGLMNTEEGVIGTERGKRLGAYDTLKLGGSYDVGSDLAALNKLATDFIGTIGAGLKTGLGSTPLYSTAGLPGVAGAAQSGQNIVPKAGAAGAAAAEAVPTEDQTKLGQNVLF